MKRKLLAISFLLGFLFVMNALGNSSARDILGQEVNKNEVEVTRGTVEYPQKEKETFDGINEVAHMRKLRLGGKKVMAQKGSSVDLEDEKGAEEGASKISGATYSDGICDFEREGDIKVKCKVLGKSSTHRSSKGLVLLLSLMIIMGLGTTFPNITE
ncbi:hypothetical protein L6164_006607 [Bauhinia variegata]|uniref:Uncharacterized protein n=1 Tax=Bauhinia variegata TaxID=167791 RepID=A0ACB9PWI2_BAUVA|nr:hypothetical protein L6164_006607 [Bauhinia variegata]